MIGGWLLRIRRSADDISSRVIQLAANVLPISHGSATARMKNALLRLAGIRIARMVFIDTGFRCIRPSNIEIENFVSLGHDNHVWAFMPVRIRHHTITAKDLLIISGSHDTDSYEPLPDQEVEIGPGCWIGARVTILGGVRIGRGSIIGAGSLVRDEIPEFSVVAGVPARVLRRREPSEQIWNHFGYYNVAELEPA